jgi:hypothetical protein
MRPRTRGLGHEGVLETTVMVLRHLLPHPNPFPHSQKAALRAGIDR